MVEYVHFKTNSNFECIILKCFYISDFKIRGSYLEQQLILASNSVFIELHGFSNKLINMPVPISAFKTNQGHFNKEQA
ncbi:hypothetical protein Xmau_03391 [Xenorhabdus mauleonii]|uniref:Uncharacterized protein n=1 Tax=Xenorhabdus mauleonii TaxID=351675 RepID=A0A1I3QXE7_9GAMM|nr:hypothetical protein Xmau_03391 [Xenorhabdus mauleonii]SFJ38758.1 hypothetical protein SAMN05421680_10868 [Xenorhabdus mauleonii]